MNDWTKESKLMAKRMLAIFMIMILCCLSGSAALADGSWTCPNCGQEGNTGNFCGNCAAARPSEEWVCPNCGKPATGKFCAECGTKKPETAAGWTCPSSGTVNKGKFCAECGAKKPAGVPQYRCDKYGWEPKDPTKPPKFCPECGDPFDTGDAV